MLDMQLFGARAELHHLVNVLWHCASVCMLYAVMLRITGRLSDSVAIALLFALHPLNVESVAWIAERKNVLSSFWLFVTLWMYARYSTTNRLCHYAVAIVAFELCLLSKAMAITLPGILLAYECILISRLRTLQLRKRAVSLAPFMVMSGLTAVVALCSQDSGGALTSLEALPLSCRVANMMRAYWWYLMQVIEPRNLSFFYDWQTYQVSPLAAYVYGVALLGVSFALYRMRRRCRTAWLGWLWYLITIVPVCGLCQVGGQAMANRYAYVPAIGLFVVVVGLAGVLGRALSAAKRYIGLAAVCAWGIYLLCVTVGQVECWSNSLTLFERGLSCDGGNWVAHQNLGRIALENGDRWSAVAHFHSVLRIRGNHSGAHYGLGLACAELGNYRHSMLHFCEAAESGNSKEGELRAKAYAETASSVTRLCRDGNVEDAIALIPRERCSSVIRAAFEYVMGMAFIESGEICLALLCLRQAAEYSGSGDMMLRYCRAAISVNEVIEAESLCRALIAQVPAFGEAYAVLGSALMKQYRYDEACNALSEAIVLRPSVASFRNNRAVCYAKLGRKAEARKELESAIGMAPELPSTHLNMGCLLVANGEIEAGMREVRLGFLLGQATPFVNAEMEVVIEWSELVSATEGLTDISDSVRLVSLVVGLLKDP